ncbi:MAG TPA: HEAT repeat domain-containing protein [Geobacteraceae bacterium]
MERRKKIDESLRERHGIVLLLERLKNDGITFDEMEEIGAKLKKAGKRALPPLVRRLWREKSGDLISKYTYLLDFFEEDVWLDQLIQITLRRRDLEEEGKAALLSALEGYGIDISSPPFAALLKEIGGPLRATLPRLLDKGEEGVVGFIEDFLFAAPELRLSIIRELPHIADERVVSLLEIMLRIDDPAIFREAVIVLGRIREPAAVLLLKEARERADGDVRELASKSLRRLSLIGVETDGVRPAPALPLPNFATCASPFDGAGFRTLCLCRRTAEGCLASLFMQIHEESGMTAAWGSGRVDEADFARQWEDIRLEEGMVTIDPAYALRLVNDAIYRCRQTGAFLPPEFYVLAGMFGHGELAPAPYIPDFAGYARFSPYTVCHAIAASATLFDDDYFAGWFLATGRVYDFAEEWVELEKKGGGKALTRELEAMVARFCRELLAPQLEPICRRLLLTADLMRRTGRDRELVELTLAVALNLTDSGVPLHKHPFLKRFALESMDMAREGLAEGYDLREQECMDDDWE